MCVFVCLYLLCFVCLVVVALFLFVCLFVCLFVFVMFCLFGVCCIVSVCLSVLFCFVIVCFLCLIDIICSALFTVCGCLPCLFVRVYHYPCRRVMCVLHGCSYAAMQLCLATGTAVRQSRFLRQADFMNQRGIRPTNEPCPRIHYLLKQYPLGLIHRTLL